MPFPLPVFPHASPQTAAPSGMTREEGSGSVPQPPRVIPEFATQISGTLFQGERSGGFIVPLSGVYTVFYMVRECVLGPPEGTCQSSFDFAQHERFLSTGLILSEVEARARTASLMPRAHKSSLTPLSTGIPRHRHIGVNANNTAPEGARHD
jgi:hypothetical protein